MFFDNRSKRDCCDGPREQSDQTNLCFAHNKDSSCFLFKGSHTDTLHGLLYQSSELFGWESHTHTHPLEPSRILLSVTYGGTGMRLCMLIHLNTGKKNSFAANQSQMKDVRRAACDRSFSGDKKPEISHLALLKATKERLIPAVQKSDVLQSDRLDMNRWDTDL